MPAIFCEQIDCGLILVQLQASLAPGTFLGSTPLLQLFIPRIYCYCVRVYYSDLLIDGMYIG